MEMAFTLLNLIFILLNMFEINALLRGVFS